MTATLHTVHLQGNVQPCAQVLAGVVNAKVPSYLMKKSCVQTCGRQAMHHDGFSFATRKPS